MDTNFGNINKNDIRFFNMAKELSKFSENSRHMHLGAVAVLNNKVISRGFNKNKTDPLQAKYSKYLGIDESKIVFKSSIHAEIDCLKKIYNDKDIPWSKVKIYVYRSLKTKDYGLARPCVSCMQFIKDLGIRHVYYTTNIGFGHEILL